MSFKTVLYTIAVVGMTSTGTFAAQHHDHGGHNMNEHENTAAAVGVLNSIDAENNKVNISHEPIKAIGWPAMKMDMVVAKKVNLSKFKAGDAVNFKLAKGDNGIYIIVDISHKK